MSTHFTLYCKKCDKEADVHDTNWMDVPLADLYDNRRVVVMAYRLKHYLIEFHKPGLFDFLSEHLECKTIYLKSEYGDIHPLFGRERHLPPPWYDCAEPCYPVKP